MISCFSRHGHGQVRLAGPGRSDAKHQVVIADRRDIASLAGRAGTDGPAGKLQFDAGMVHVQGLARHFGQHLRNFLRRQRAGARGQILQLLEHLRGMGHGLVLALDVDPVVAAGNRNAERLSDLAEMLVAGSEKSQQTLGVDQRNGGF